MAPMEGLTDFTYRNAYEKTFGKGRITKYFTPFISPNKSENFLARELRDIDREHNKETYTVVQVMTNEAKDFIWTAKMLYEKYGYHSPQKFLQDLVRESRYYFIFDRRDTCMVESDSTLEIQFLGRFGEEGEWIEVRPLRKEKLPE